jgi:hypothetical protein
MRVLRTLLALLLCAAAARAAEGTGVKVEMRTLKGEVIRGELVGVTAAEVVVATPDGKTAVPTPQVLSVDLEQPEKPLPPEKFLDVELVDGTMFHCAACVLKGKEAALTLATGQELKLPLLKIGNLVRDAQDPKRRKAWNQQLGRKKAGDVLAKLNDGALAFYEGTLGAVSDDGKTIKLTVEDLGTREVVLDTVQGLIFERAVDPNMPLPICKLIDAFGTVVMVQEIELKNGEAAVTTPAGVKTTYPLKLVQRFDYNRDKLKFLSEMEPSLEKIESEEPFQGGSILKDVNLKGEPIRLGETTYQRGLVLHAVAEVVYDLRGDYREFKAVVGLDKSLLDPKTERTTVKVEIETDGRVRYSKTFSLKDKTAFEGVTFGLKDAQKLRIVVTPGDDQISSYHLHVALADAKVTK